MSGTDARQVDDLQDFGTGPDGIAARWQAELQAAERERHAWLRQCDQIERRYREHKTGQNQYETERVRFNALWSNIQTLLPAIYSRPPEPIVIRRFRDADPIARAASQILQRSLSYVIDSINLHTLVREIVLDYLLYGRGVAWVRYEPHFATIGVREEGYQIGNTGTDEIVEGIAWEEIQWDFIHRNDFLHGPGKVWSDVPWIARIVRLTRADGQKRFGRKFNGVQMTYRSGNHQSVQEVEPDEIVNRAEVAEIWDRSSGTVIWIGNPFGDPVLLDQRDDPLQLEGFYPCPRPLFGTHTTSTPIPVPDYVEYQDQAQELDDLTARIAKLTESIKVAGTYDSSVPQLARIFEEGTENQLIPLDNWLEFSSKGGTGGGISLVPMLDMIQTLQALIEARSQVKQDMWEISGIADVLRGATAPEETATAQRIKGRYASMRLTDRQLEVARYVRDMLRITGEIICEHFQPETLRLSSNFDMSEMNRHWTGEQIPVQPAGNIQMVPIGMPDIIGMIQPPTLFDQAVAMLRNDKLRGFRIDIEDKSTIAAEDEEEKLARIQFLKYAGDYITAAAQIPPSMAPAMLPLLGQMLLFGARAFRSGLEMETTIEDAISKLQQSVQQQSANTAPSPDMIRAQTDARKAEAEIQIKSQELQASLMKARADLAERQMQRALAQQRMQEESAQNQAQNAQDATEHQIMLDKQAIEHARFQQEQLDAERSYQAKLEELAQGWADLEIRRQRRSIQ